MHTIVLLILAASGLLINHHSDGSFNMPSEQQIEDAPGELEDQQNEMRRARLMPDAISEKAIEDAPDVMPEPAPKRGWWRGDFNIPTEREVDHLAKWRARTYDHQCWAALTKAWDSGEIIVGNDWRTIRLDVFNPMPEAQSQWERDRQVAVAAEFGTRKNMVPCFSAKQVNS